MDLQPRDLFCLVAGAGDLRGAEPLPFSGYAGGGTKIQVDVGDP